MKLLSNRDVDHLSNAGLPVRAGAILLHGKDESGKDFVMDLKTGEGFTVEVNLEGYLRRCPYVFRPGLSS